MDFVTIKYYRSQSCSLTTDLQYLVKLQIVKLQKYIPLPVHLLYVVVVCGFVVRASVVGGSVVGAVVVGLLL